MLAAAVGPLTRPHARPGRGQALDARIAGDSRLDGDIETALPSAHPQAAGPLPARLLDNRFHLLRELGRGGLGVVFQAHDRLSDRIVAVKMPRPEWLHDPHVRESLLTEATLTRRVSDPHVLSVESLRESAEAFLYLVMEWMDRGSAAQLLRDCGALRPRTATRLALAACRALRAVHRAGLIHRDVKPANLLLSGDGALKLADFGIALDTSSREASAPTAFAGTPGYCSPEQARCLPLDPRCDLYGLGVTYLNLLTGSNPLHPPGRCHLCRFCPAPPSASWLSEKIPPPCAAIVRRALAERLSERYADADAMIADLEAARCGEGCRSRQTDCLRLWTRNAGRVPSQHWELTSGDV